MSEPIWHDLHDPMEPENFYPDQVRAMRVTLARIYDALPPECPFCGHDLESDTICPPTCPTYALDAVVRGDDRDHGCVEDGTQHDVVDGRQD